MQNDSRGTFQNASHRRVLQIRSAFSELELLVGVCGKNLEICKLTRADRRALICTLFRSVECDLTGQMIAQAVIPKSMRTGLDKTAVN